MSEETNRLMSAAHEARYRLKIGAVGYDEAKKAAQPYIEHINRHARKIAEEHGVHFRPVSVVGFLR